MNHSEVLPVRIIHTLRGDVRCAYDIQEPVLKPGHIMAPLDARAVNNQVHRGYVLALLQGVPCAMFGGF